MDPNFSYSPSYNLLLREKKILPILPMEKIPPFKTLNSFKGSHLPS